MKVSDYIVQFFVDRNIRHFFGYQGTMIAHLVDAIERNPEAHNHSCYHEQAAAFAACGYAQGAEGPAVAYATSGPGAVNLLSGVANAFFDSIPAIFICGQLNSNEYTSIPSLRQQGFQEIDIVSMSKAVTKASFQVTQTQDIPNILEYAYQVATAGRKGPVLIDIPMDIQSSILLTEDTTSSCSNGDGFTDSSTQQLKEALDRIIQELSYAKKPIFLLGSGLDRAVAKKELLETAEKLNIPIITSLPASSFLESDHALNMGYLGSAYGHRWANIIADTKADLLICLGISLCPRQRGLRENAFARQAKIIRVDVDESQLARKVHTDETEFSFLADASQLTHQLKKQVVSAPLPNFQTWATTCQNLKSMLIHVDDNTSARTPNNIVKKLSTSLFHDHSVIAVDVGQHMMWTAQSFKVQPDQKLLYSGGHGAMGYALPAAIGASYLSTKRVGCICGDGAFQMNLQELQWVAREQLPLTMVVLNNQSLGLIRQQQEDYFNSVYAGATISQGFSSCNFCAVAQAYGIPSITLYPHDILSPNFSISYDRTAPFFIEIILQETTYALPKTPFGKPMHHQSPLLSPAMIKMLNSL